MLVLDNTLLSDYLNGRPAARAFLEAYEHEPWATPSVACFETYVGVLHGYIQGDLAAVRSGIESSMDVLPVSAETAWRAAALQQSLLDLGLVASHTHALIAASAAEHGGTLATADRHFWRDDVKDLLAVAEYDPDAPPHGT